MRPFQSVSRKNDLVTAILLAAIIVFMQWAGLQHGVRHAGFKHSPASTTSYTINVDDGDTRHSCIAFDAAALADSFPFAPCLLPLLTGVRMLALWNAFASWDAPFTLNFSSRAPPLP